MKRNIVGLCLCALVGPCITIHSERTWLTVMEGTGDNINKVDVAKEMSGEIKGEVVGIKASATATANLTTNAKDMGKEAGKAAVKELAK